MSRSKSAINRPFIVIVARIRYSSMYKKVAVQDINPAQLLMARIRQQSLYQSLATRMLPK